MKTKVVLKIWKIKNENNLYSIFFDEYMLKDNNSPDLNENRIYLERMWKEDIPQSKMIAFLYWYKSKIDVLKILEALEKCTKYVSAKAEIDSTVEEEFPPTTIYSENI